MKYGCLTEEQYRGQVERIIQENESADEEAIRNYAYEEDILFRKEELSEERIDNMVQKAETGIKNLLE